MKVIGAYAIAGGTSRAAGVIYVRNEYPMAVTHLQTAIEQARSCGLLGENILGSGFESDQRIPCAEIAGVRKRDLGLPAGDSRQDGAQSRQEGEVGGIPDGGGLRKGPDAQHQTHDDGDPGHDVKRHLLGDATFESADRRRRDTGSACRLLLAQVVLQPR